MSMWVGKTSEFRRLVCRVFGHQWVRDAHLPLTHNCHRCGQSRLAGPFTFVDHDDRDAVIP